MDQKILNNNLSYKLLDKSGLNRFLRYLLSGNPKFIMYHGVVDDNDDIECWWLIKQSKFANQIKYIKNHFNIISIDEAYAYISANKGFPKNACVLTFDDGYKNYMTKALPILKAEQVPSTVYITTGISPRQGMIWADKLFYALYKSKLDLLDLTDIKFGIWPMYDKQEKIESAHEIVNSLKRIPPQRKTELMEEIEKYLEISQDKRPYLNGNNPFVLLSIEDIQKLSLEPLVTIGSHSVNHEILTTLSIKEAEEEITLSKHMLELWINKPINHFSYPDGKYNAPIKEIVKKAGYKTATRIGLGLFKSNRIYEIDRLAVGAWDNCYTFKAMLSGFYSIKEELYNFFFAKDL